MDGPNHHHISIYVILADDVTQPFYTAVSWNGDNKVILISKWVGLGPGCADIGINPTKEIGFN